MFFIKKSNVIIKMTLERLKNVKILENKTDIKNVSTISFKMEDQIIL